MGNGSFSQILRILEERVYRENTKSVLTILSLKHPSRAGKWAFEFELEVGDTILK